MRFGTTFGVLAAVIVATAAVGTAVAGLRETVVAVKPAVVAVGTYEKMRRPAAVFLGTGFAVADGRHVVTNLHVLPGRLDEGKRETMGVFTGAGGNPEFRAALQVAGDEEHDLALLRIEGAPLRPLTVGDSGSVREGDRVAFTGFPIGMVLGFYPVTHAGIVSSVTPIAIPRSDARQLEPAVLARLQSPYDVFQLDATAYPGNSGSPLYDPETGVVWGVLNMVFVKETKEHVLDRPSAISYAIPARHVRELLRGAGLLPER